jgi:hypothetical protein
VNLLRLTHSRCPVVRTTGLLSHLQCPQPYTHTTHTHTHPGALVLRFNSIYTQHTLALLRNKQDAAPRQRHSKTRPLGLDSKQDAAPRQRHRLPKTFPLVTRQGTRSTRQISSAEDLSMPHLPLLPDLNLVLLFFLIGTHSLPTHPLHSSSTGSILAKLLKTQAYTRYFAPTQDILRLREPTSP